MWLKNSHNFYKCARILFFMDVSSALRDLGLEEKETNVYLSLLESGLAKANEVSQHSGVERRTCYEILNRLKQKNFVSSAIKNGVQHFQATDPKKLLEVIREKERKYKAILPELEALTRLPKEDLNVEILLGKEGLRTIFREILNTKKDVFNFGGFTHYDETDYLLWEQFLRDMKLAKLKESVLYTPDEKIIKIPTGTYKKLAIDHKIPTNAIIYGDNVAIIIFGKHSYTILKVENKAFSDSYKKYFSYYWKKSK